jgi:hypothetical protein
MIMMIVGALGLTVWRTKKKLRSIKKDLSDAKERRGKSLR